MSNKIYVKAKKIIIENLWFILSIIFIIFIFNFELPYNIETPGGYISLNDRINIEGQNVETGSFGMAYVTMLKGNIPFLLLSHLNPNWDIISKEDLTYDNETIKEMNKREEMYLNEAIGAATVVAYKNSGKEYNIKETKLYISYLDNQESDLKVGDNIIMINGNSVSSLKEIKDYVENLDDDYVNVSVIRDNETITVKTKLKDYDGTKKIGIMIIPNYKIETNPTMKVTTKKNESGPSGGLMLALSIYNKLTDYDLTKGKKIIGTGTIDMDGNVGEIGGVKYKLLGAYKSKAEIFLCPKENYDEAIKIKNERDLDIEIVGVSTFDEAINYLKGEG